MNDVISKATADQQVVMKEARTISKKMNEANVKSNSQVNVTNQPMQPSSSSNTSGTNSSSSSQSSGESLNIDFSNFSNKIENSKYTTPDITGVKTGLNLNQQQVDKQNEDIEKAKLEDDVERLMKKYDQQDSNDSGSKFKLKDDDK